MPLTPFLAVELESSLSPDEVMEAIQEAVEPKQWFRFKVNQRPFEGTVSGNSFEIQRINRGRNAWLVARGSVSSSASGSCISLDMRPPFPYLAFTCVWIAVVAILGVRFALDAVAAHSGWGNILVPVGMIAFVWGATVVSSAREAKKIEKILARRTEARRREPTQPQVKPEGFY
ncbi:MAG TPA: hypothetical protein VG937_39850 [Polyangiaceae bacterium]|nr:hypothetical protein [Polyangiaceae bacterium]